MTMSAQLRWTNMDLDQPRGQVRWAVMKLFSSQG